jgi:hypothetical protein
MTSLGKFLVFINLIFCVFLAAFSLAIYTNRVEWADADKKTGEVYVLKKEADTISAGYPAAASRWQKMREGVLVRETGKSADGAKSNQFAGRSADRLWYEQQLRQLRFEATDVKAAKAIVFDDATGQVKLNPADYNRPQMAPATERDPKNPLASLAYYNKKDRETLDELEKKMVEMLTHIKTDIDATERMNGPKGLKQRLEDERVKGLQLEDEQALIGPQILDVEARSGTTRDRTTQLKARIKELQRALAAEDDK